jgi:manganese transport protein
VKKVMEIALGIMTALGGFVDIGELVFTAQAGAVFKYSLLWPIVVGTIGIVVYSEMCGRIAAVAKQPVFTVVEKKLGRRMGFVVWIASTLVNIATCAAEIGGIALVLRLLTGFGPSWFPLAVAACIGVLIWILPFKWIERVFGFAGLAMIIFFVAAIVAGPDWSSVGHGLVPNLPTFHSHREILLYGYFVVGILSSLMMPYEVYFYSSGGIEEGWKPKDVPMNRFIAGAGLSLGSLVAMAILVLGAIVFAPLAIHPDTLGSAAALVGSQYGQIGIVIGLIAIITALGGAAVETALAGGYNFAQFFHFTWGRSRPARETPQFDAAWIVVLALGAIVMMTGVDPLVIVELSVMLAVVCLPFTYLPILLAARDRSLMGRYANGPISNALGWFFFGLICVASVAAPILLIATGMGSY